ncbi:MAG: hypothetical protein AAB647_00365 [Patescibacteria group bacterium]
MLASDFFKIRYWLPLLFGVGWIAVLAIFLAPNRVEAAGYWSVDRADYKEYTCGKSQGGREFQANMDCGWLVVPAGTYWTDVSYVDFTNAGSFTLNDQTEQDCGYYTDDDEDGIPEYVCYPRLLGYWSRSHYFDGRDTTRCRESHDKPVGLKYGGNGWTNLAGHTLSLDGYIADQRCGWEASGAVVMRFFITPPIPPPTVDLKANNLDGPITVDYNSTVNLTWTTANATNCSASNGWSGAKTASGGQENQGPLSASQTYSLTCTGPGGTSPPDSIVVNVNPLPPPASTPTVSGLPACTNAAYTGQGVISWSGIGRTDGFYVDLDDDPNFGSYFNKQVATGTSTDTNNFRGISPQTNQTLVLQPQTTYYVRIYNGQHSPTASFQVPYCPPTVDLKGQTETGSPANGPLQVDYNHPITLTWSSQNATSCTASDGANNWPGNKAVANSSGESSGNLTRSAVFIITCANSVGLTASDSVIVTVVFGPNLSSINVTGDIFSGTGVAGFSVDPKSVVSSGGAISILGTNLTIPNYQQANQTSWETIRKQMLANVSRLKNERAVTLVPNNGSNVSIPAPGSTSRLFNSNPASGNPFDGTQAANTNHPEGGVFYVAGDLVIKAPFTFLNRGTIIVAGSIRLEGEGAITVSQKGTLGLAALGTGGITIDPVIKEFQAIALFAANGPLVFE